MTPRFKIIAVQLFLFVLLAGNIELYCCLHLQRDATGHRGDMPSFLNDGAICIPDPVRGWRLRRDIEACTVNEDGLRGPEVAVPRPKDELRILCLGGSVTWGWGLQDSQTYPFLLQQKLSATGRAVTVINGGTPGFTSENCAAMLLDLAPRYQPQVVTLMMGFNEPWVQRRARDTVQVPLPSDDVDWLRALLHKSATYQYLYTQVRPHISTEVNLSADQRWQVSADNVRLICEQMHALNFRFLIVWEARRPWASLQQAAKSGNDFTQLRDPTSVENLHHEVSAVARAYDIPILDMNEQVVKSGMGQDDFFQSNPGREKFMLTHDPVHPTLSGCRYIADVLADRLNTLGWLNP